MSVVPFSLAVVLPFRNRPSPRPLICAGALPCLRLRVWVVFVLVLVFILVFVSSLSVFAFV